MSKLLQKRSILLFLFAILTMLSCFAFIGHDNVSSASDSVKEFLVFEDEYKQLLNEESSNAVMRMSGISNSQSPYSLKRLIVAGQLSQTYGANKVIEGYKNYYILCYDSEEATERAYNLLSLRDDLTVVVDQQVYASGYSDNTYSYSDYDSWGAEAMDVGGIGEYLEDYGTDEEVVVAVFDTGIRTTHDYFQDRFLVENGQIVGYSYYTNSSSTYDFEDDNGHGTHVAGIISQLTPKNVKILPIKVLSASGMGSFGTIFLAALRFAEVYQDYNICCINMSISGNNSGLETIISSAIDTLRENNILCVVSAGNDEMDTTSYYPAFCDSAITVSSLKESEDGVYEYDSSYSNFGDSVDISAPGTSIISASYRSDSGLAMMSGTSMAAPHVSAAIALLCSDGVYWQSTSPTYSADIIEERLYQNAIDLGEEGKDEFYGYGMVNLRYFNVDSSQDVLTFFGDDGQEIDTSQYIEFEEEFTLTIEAEANYQIYYTTDFTLPTINSKLYTAPIDITHSDIYYFMAFKIENGYTSASSILYKLDLFNPNDDIDDFFVNTNGKLTRYTGHFSELKVPSVVDGRTVTGLGARLFNENEIVSLTLPNTCTKIGEYCFSGCENLKNIEMDGVTTISSYAFEGCSLLNEVDLKNVQYLGEEKANQDILGRVFKGCTSLEEVYLPNVVAMGELNFENSSVNLVAIGNSFTLTYGESVGEGITIYGYEGSYAEQYSEEYGNTFIVIEPFSLITDLPLTKETSQGAEERLEVSASGLGIKYQWFSTSDGYDNGVALNGENERYLDIPTYDIGTVKYFARLTDWEGNVIDSSICEVNVKRDDDVYICQIFTSAGWKYYTSLSNAIKDCKDNGVIVLIQDCYLSDSLIIDKNITLLSSNRATIYIDEALESEQTIFNISKTLTIGFNQESYQDIPVTNIYIDGQNLSLNTVFSISQNGMLSLQENCQIENFTANCLVFGEDNPSLTMQGGVIADCTLLNSQGNYLIDVAYLTIENAMITNILAEGGGIINARGNNIVINNLTLSGNYSKYLIWAGVGGQAEINNVEFVENDCQSLIYCVFTKEEGFLSLKNCSSENNFCATYSYYDLYLSEDETNENGYKIEVENCNFTSFYINNSSSYIPVYMLGSVKADKIKIDVFNGEAYQNNPIIITVNDNIGFLYNDKYNFAIMEQNDEQNYIYLQEKVRYKLEYIIEGQDSVIQYYSAGEEIVPIENPEKVGYKFVGWFEDEEGERGYNFSVMPEQNVVIYAKFQELTFTITSSSSENGQISPSGISQIEYGGRQTFSIVADNGYFVSNIYVDDRILTELELENAITNGYTFSNVKENHTIHVDFEALTFNIYYHLISGQIETISCKYNDMIEEYSPIREGYDFIGWYQDEQLLNEYELGLMPAEDIHLYAKWQIQLFILNSYVEGNGSISPSGEISRQYNSTVTYSFIADEGHYVSSIIVDGVQLDSQQLSNAINYGYSFSNISKAHSISVSFDVYKYAINLTVEGDGRFYCNQDLSIIEYGEDRLFYIDTDFDNYDVEIYVNGSLIENGDHGVLRINDIQQNLNIGVRFVEKPFFSTEVGNIVLIVGGVISAIILVSTVIIIIYRRKRFYSDMNNY